MPGEMTLETVRSADGTSIAFERAGMGQPLILVDAAGCFRGFGPMGELAELLSSEFMVFTYDRRGRGESTDTQPYTVDREIDDLQAIIDAAGGSALVYGFSSGAVLALHAAARGLAIRRLALLEPPLALDGQRPPESELGAEVAELVAAGRRGDAVEHFQRSIGVPQEMITGMRHSPSWPTMEGIAHTLVYDCAITSSMTYSRLATVITPTLVLDSQGSTDDLGGWAREVCRILPCARHRSLHGQWHGVPAQVLAPALADYFMD